ncbi:glycolate oxidase subunit GlcD, partial [Paenibacillus sepulcri]|nr:glycolate oxidase subunit GlcD [Paenibacillus sepulcri]
MLAEAVKKELQAIMGDQWVRDDKEALVTHSYDGTPMLQSLPDGVIYPASTEHVSETLKVLSRHRIPVISRGS